MYTYIIYIYIHIKCIVSFENQRKVSRALYKAKSKIRYLQLSISKYRMIPVLFAYTLHFNLFLSPPPKKKYMYILVKNSNKNTESSENIARSLSLHRFLW